MRIRIPEVLFGGLLLLITLVLLSIVFFESDAVSAGVMPENGGVVAPTVQPMADPA